MVIQVIFLFIIGLLFLLKGAEKLIDSSIKIARHFGISELVIGLTLISFGTSLPEFAIGTISALQGEPVISIANVIGSNIYNLLVLTALIGFVTTYHFKTINILQRDIVWLLLTAIWLTAVAFNGTISVGVGVLFISSYLIYIYYLYDTGEKVKTRKRDGVTWKTYLALAVSIILIYLGAELTVTNAIELAKLLHISEWAISAGLIGAGTGLPETATAVVALRKKKLKIGVGNLIGSNIFNILIVAGVTSLITPMQVDFASHFYSFFFLMISSVLIALIAIRGSIRKKTAMVSITLYLIYLWLLFK